MNDQLTDINRLTDGLKHLARNSPADSAFLFEVADRLWKLQECVNRAHGFVDDVMPQIGELVIQDYSNLNVLNIMLHDLSNAVLDKPA